MTLGLKYKLGTLTFGVARHHLISDAHNERAHQFLMRRLSARISSLRTWSAYFEGPSQIWNFYAYAEHRCKKLMHMLMVCISFWCVCLANASVPDPYAQGKHQLMIVCSACFEGTALLKIRLSTCVRNFATPNEPLNMKKKNLHGSRPPVETLWCKIMKIRSIENLILGHF